MNTYNVVVEFCIIVSNIIWLSSIIILCILKSIVPFQNFYFTFISPTLCPLFFFTLSPCSLSIICISLLLSPSNFLSSFNLINRQIPPFLSHATHNSSFFNQRTPWICSSLSPVSWKQECGGVWPIRAKLS